MTRLTIVNLETLCWIARLGSFSAAAERMNTTQPGVSRRIKELEESIGVSLFYRKGRRMELTIQGRELVQRVQPLLSGLEDVVVFRDHPAAATGVIRMGVGEIVAVTWLPVLMAQLKQQMPGVHYEIEVDLTVNMRHHLETGMLDLAILAAPVDAHQLTATPIGGVNLHWYIGGAPARGMAPGESGVREALAHHPIWCVARPSAMHPMAVEMLRRYGVPRGTLNTCDSVQSIVELVAQGAGIGLLPENLVQQRVRAGQLVRLTDDDSLSTRFEFVIARPRDHEQAIVSHIVELATKTSPFLAT